MRAQVFRSTLSVGITIYLFCTIFLTGGTLAKSSSSSKNLTNYQETLNWRQGIKLQHPKSAASTTSCSNGNCTVVKGPTSNDAPRRASEQYVLQKKRRSKYTIKTTTPSPSTSPTSEKNNGIDLNKLFQKVRGAREQCKRKETQSFYCQRVKWSWWFVKQLEKNTTRLNNYVELMRNEDASLAQLDETQLLPESWPEKLIYNVLSTYGAPVDQYVFLKFKQYFKSSELKVAVPSIGTSLVVGPATHPSTETGRILFDPGFNLKMKLPFFRDEVKFAVSTGPSFLAGLGIGMVMLGVKSMVSPVLLGMKAMMLSFFMKDMSPFDFLKVFGFGGSNDEAVEEVQNIEVYDPPIVSNPYDNVLDKTPIPTGASNIYGPPGPTSPSFGISGYSPTGMGQNLHYAPPPPKINPMLSYGVPAILTGPSGYRPTIPQWNHNHNWEDARNVQSGPLLSAPSSGSFGSFTSPQPQESHQKNKIEPSDSGFKYVPSTALQLEVENFDPFYSPLLSRIDSIFMHWGFTDEGCRERAVCSIYKSPVKFAPYSNLLSAQLSKHQSELKRPASTSPKVLRYFKYMKAAKDGQASSNCLELYPKCNIDTEKPSNLPMVKTFQQLTELMGSTSRGH